MNMLFINSATYTDGLTTKQDLALLEARLDNRFSDVRKEIEATKFDIIKWVAGANIATIGIIFTILKLISLKM